MINKWVPFVLAASLIGLTGCADNRNDINDVNRANVNRVNDNGNGNLIRNTSNQNLRVSSTAARKVEKMKEVDRAHVIIRNNNAYVAVRLKNDRNNVNNAGNTAGNTTNRNMTTNGIGANGINPGNGTTGTGTNAGITGAGGANTGMYGNGYNSGTTGNTTGINGNGYLNGDATGNTGTIRGGRNAGTNNTSRTNYNQVSNPLEQKIADQVRKADRSIHNVYVSYDTSFYNQMTNYTNDIQNGRNRDGLLDNFNSTINRFFR